MSSVNASSQATLPSKQPGFGTRTLAAFQTIGRALMLPIAVLPAAGLLLRLGQQDLLNWPWMAAAGGAVFTNLSLLFAIGITISLCGMEGSSALSAIVGFIVFDGVFTSIVPWSRDQLIPYLPVLKTIAVTDITMGVLEGILVALVTAYLYKRFHDIRLPDYLAFFGGKRFVPIVTSISTLILGLIFGLIWPVINIGINAIGLGIVDLGPFGAGIYGFFNRLLIPLGLHHVLNSYFWFQLGSYKGATGVVATGDLHRYFAGDPNAGHYMAGYFPIMMFGLPAACLAMIRHAKFPKVAAGILLSAAFASFLTGVTEPIEFAFIFVAPMLFVVHAVLTGTSLAVCYLLNIKIGFSFSAGLFDLVLNFTKPNTTNAWLLIVVGLAYAVIYYFVFSFCIVHFDLATPGRGEASTGLAADWILPESQRGPKASKKTAEAVSDTAVEASTEAKDRDDLLAEQLYEALGRKENIESLEGCITRLRLFVKDPQKLDDARLKSLGASGIIKKGNIVQVVMGTQSDRLATRINRIIKTGSVVETE
jgi:PTS system, glucose-like IIB component